MYGTWCTCDTESLIGHKICWTITKGNGFTTVEWYFIVTVSSLEFMIILLTLIESLNDYPIFVAKFPVLNAVT